MTEGSTLEPWFITGFCQTAGSFTFSRGGRSLFPYFAIKLRGSELQLMESIRSYFGGAGRIYHLRTGSEGALYYRVHSGEDLARVIEHFDHHSLVGSKGASYQIWRAMVLLKRERFRKPARSELEALARQLSDATSERRSSR